ncbi:type II toxin-antitoxin system RelE/ParE family toxin, partial [Acidithiobacillus ferridurans]|uniref:type II toxin-antitoxin system RelE/ParE family toxin n=1 Tax=Acidithiobacillus ferridurans TaxID=1232575 RepID=UPI001C07E900
MLSEYGPSLRLPHSRAFGDGLFELRPRGRAGIGRAFYCFMVGKRVVVLHAFIKKAQQTPDRELKLARVNGDLKLTHFSCMQRFKTDTPPILTL